MVKKKASKKATPTKRQYVKKNTQHWAELRQRQNKRQHIIDEGALEPFEIEAAPPSFRLNPDLAHTLKRIEETVKVLLPGQAFIVPSKSRHTIKKFIEEKWPAYKFMYSVIKDNRSMMRIYLINIFDKKRH